MTSLKLSTNPRSERRYLAFVLLLGLGIRCWHLGWGLPEIFEEATPFTVAWRFWNWGSPGFDFNPHFFNYPAFTFYLNFILQAIHYGIGHISGSFADLSAFQHSYVSDPTIFIIISRLVSVSFDFGTIIMVYILARDFIGSIPALFPALLAAVNPLMIRNSHLINVDTPLTFFSVLSVYGILKLLQSGEWKWYLLAGAGIGFASSSKYNGALLLPVLLLAHLLRSSSPSQAARSLVHVRLIAASGLALALFLFMNPYILLSFNEFYQDFSFEESHMAQGHLGIDANQSTVAFYLVKALPEAVGWIFAGIIGLSSIYLLLRRKKEDLLLLAFPLLYIAVIMSWKMRADRYILPAIPMLILVGVVGVNYFTATMKESTAIIAGRLSSPVAQLAIRSLIVLLLVAQPVVADVTYQSSLSLPDTRAIAKEWILHNIPKGGVIVTPPFGLVLPDTMYRIFPMPFLSVNPERVAPFYDTRWFDDFDLVVGSDYDYNRYLKDTIRYHDFIAYYDSLRSRYALVHEVAPNNQQPGPSLWLYRPTPTTGLRFESRLFEKLTNMPESVWVSRFLKNLAILLIEKGKYEKTEQVAREILSVESMNIEALRMLAASLESLGRDKEMLNELDTLLEQDPLNGEVLALKGNLLLRSQRDKEAEIVLRKSLEVNPRIEGAYDDLLRIYVNRKDKKNAVDILTRHRALLSPGSEKTRLIDKDLETLQSVQ